MENNKAPVEKVDSTERVAPVDKVTPFDKLLKWLPLLSIVFAFGVAYATIQFTKSVVDKLEGKVDGIDIKLQDNKNSLIRLEQKFEDLVPSKEHKPQ